MNEVHGYGDVVVTAHVLATQAGLEILARGGNAVDAAIAANAVMGVVGPETCGVGGDLFALVWEPGEERPAALNASGRAGSGADADTLRREGHTGIPPYDRQSVTVPGCVYGWQALLERHGSMDFATVLAPAIRLATEGFPASAELADALADRADELAHQEAASGLYPDGRPPSPGDMVSRPGLAAVLRDVADGGVDAFYRGRAGSEIVEALDGVLTLEDLACDQAEWVDPISLEIFGLTGWTIPPNSQGYLTLATLGVFERYGPPRPETAGWVHVLAEAFRSVAWERDEILADPDHMTVDVASRLDPGVLAQRASQIDPDRAGTWPRRADAAGGTTYLCTLDAKGMGVSLIQSNYWGIGTNIGAAGFFLHNRGAGFSLEPGHPNELAPGKRPLHTLSPTLWTRSGKLHALLGTRGGHFQPQVLAQVAARLFSAGESPSEAQAGCRWTIDDFGPGSAPALTVEATAAKDLVAGLEERGWEVSIGTPHERGWGPVALIVVEDHGLRIGAADPRVPTASAGVR